MYAFLIRQFRMAHGPLAAECLVQLSAGWTFAAYYSPALFPHFLSISTALTKKTITLNVILRSYLIIKYWKYTDCCLKDKGWLIWGNPLSFWIFLLWLLWFNVNYFYLLFQLTHILFSKGSSVALMGFTNSSFKH